MHPRNKPYGKDQLDVPDRDVIGKAGEDAFAIWGGEYAYMPFKDIILPMGDPGWDAITPAGLVDVKTYRKPWNLLREYAVLEVSDIYVLAQYWDDKPIKLLGWDWSFQMLAWPYKDNGYGKINHNMPAKYLQSMSKLMDLFKGIPLADSTESYLKAAERKGIFLPGEGGSRGTY
jgi:hypothetical protein